MLWPSLMEIKNEKLLSNGDIMLIWQYKMAGIQMKGKSECVEVISDKWFSVIIAGSVDCKMTWTFRSKDGIRTKVTFTADYHITLPLMNRLAENVLIKMNERESDVVLDNLREILETC